MSSSRIESIARHIVFQDREACKHDSVALCQWAHEAGYSNVSVAYSNTGWAALWWPLRMVKFKAWVESLGFNYHEIPSEGMDALVDRKKGWPANRPKFCTFDLKIKPAQAWLETVDPRKNAVCMVGVRREESAARHGWPLYVDDSPNHGNRPLFSPLAAVAEAERNALLVRAGWETLPHRSKECSPCVNNNRADFRLMDESDIEKVERKEASSGRNMFRPHRFMGAKGICQLIKWAWSRRGKFTPEQSGCDSGMCGD